MVQALQDTGITAAVGDSSWPHLRNQANPWLAQVTSAAENATVDSAHVACLTSRQQHPCLSGISGGRAAVVVQCVNSHTAGPAAWL